MRVLVGKEPRNPDRVGRGEMSRLEVAGYHLVLLPVPLLLLTTTTTINNKT